MASRGRACVVVLVPGGHGIGRGLRTHIRSPGTGVACGSRVAARGGSRSEGILDLGGQRLRPPRSIVGTRGVHFRPGQPVRGLAGSSGTRHGPAWTAAGTPGAPYGGKQGCAPTAASPRAAVRKIGLVPSKIVKILDYGTISAGQRPVRGRDISTDPARAVRGWRRFGRGPRRHRSPTLPQVHLRYICALTCQYSSCRRDVALRQHDLGRAATMGHTRAGCADTVSIPDRSSSGRHGGTTGRTGHNAPGPAYTAVMVLPVRAAYGRVSESFPELAPAVVEHANPGRIDIVRVKRHLLGQLGDGLPHRCRRLAGVRCRGKRRLAAGGRVPSGGEQLDLEVPGEHLDEIQCLGYGLEIAPGPAPEGVGRDAERGADGDLAPCEVAWAPRR